ncbi:MAG: hypothetical protein WC524_06235 [Candidatus Aminicenantales bacterium]|nr:hypothetical protein [Acidobacteriota bacterium]
MKNILRKRLWLSFLLVSFLLIPVNLLADFNSQAGQSTPNLKEQVVRLKYIDAGSMKNLLAPYTGPYTRLSSAPGVGKVLVVSDTPENLGKILAAIKEIDVKPKDLAFTIQLIEASETGEKSDPELQSDPLIKELQKLLRYKSYRLLDATMLRAIDGETSGAIFGPDNQFSIGLRPQVSDESPQGNIRIEVRLRQIKSNQLVIKQGDTEQRAWVTIEPVGLIDTNLNLKSGDRAVVGISRLASGGLSQAESKGLILVISGKILD